RQMPDKAIAAVLNRAGKTTGRGNGWTQSRVCSLRSHNAIPTYRDGERQERDEVTLDEVAAALSVSPSTVRRLIKDDQLAANQLCKGAVDHQGRRPGSKRCQGGGDSPSTATSAVRRSSAKKTLEF
ncbi:MAG: hypothetical protein ACFCUR_21615, partial [Rhodomicrobiaceae bacterium]